MAKKSPRKGGGLTGFTDRSFFIAVPMLGLQNQESPDHGMNYEPADRATGLPAFTSYRPETDDVGKRQAGPQSIRGSPDHPDTKYRRM